MMTEDHELKELSRNLCQGDKACYCDICGEEDVYPNIEASEISGKAVCDECAEEVFEENSQFGVGA